MEIPRAFGSRSGACDGADHPGVDARLGSLWTRSLDRSISLGVVVATEGSTHIHLIVRDLDRSLPFYQAVFGLEKSFAMVPIWFSSERPVELTPSLSTKTRGPQDRGGDNGGVTHFGFRLVDKLDLGAAIAEVEAAGGRLIRRGEHEPGTLCLRD